MLACCAGAIVLNSAFEDQPPSKKPAHTQHRATMATSTTSSCTQLSCMFDPVEIMQHPIGKMNGITTKLKKCNICNTNQAKSFSIICLKGCISCNECEKFGSMFHAVERRSGKKCTVCHADALEVPIPNTEYTKLGNKVIKLQEDFDETLVTLADETRREAKRQAEEIVKDKLEEIRRQRKRKRDEDDFDSIDEYNEYIRLREERRKAQKKEKRLIEEMISNYEPMKKRLELAEAILWQQLGIVIPRNI